MQSKRKGRTLRMACTIAMVVSLFLYVLPVASATMVTSSEPVKSSERIGTVKVSASSNLNLREKPSTSSTILARLPNSTKLIVLGESGIWYNVRYKDKIGFVHSDYLKVQTKPKEQQEASAEKSKYSDKEYEVIGEYTTEFTDISNRINNITIASKAIDGIEVKPDKTFSFNETVGKRTKEKGYKLAGVLSNGKMTQGIGGGICQVSSTIHAAVKQCPSGIAKVTERYPHSKAVGYIPRKLEASVNWGTADFKFKNTSSKSLYVFIEIVEKDFKIKVQICTKK